mmetsp:Transcript_27246/g.45699  ORF Transcript_27246/g.45699 Transcript_27246/m.45699 type:complete len:908 (+) Transcript_27246:46-2769(+)
MSQFKSILEALTEGASEQPTKKAWTFLNDKGEPSDSYSYKELDSASTHLAQSLLTTQKLKENDRVLLVFFPGLDFTVALLACFKAGVIAVPVFPPDPRKMKKDLHHFVNIQSSCGASTVLTNSLYNVAKKLEDLKHIFSSESRRWPDLKWVVVDDLLKKGKSIQQPPSNSGANRKIISADRIAFLQYTSGSTSDPKGVMISHGNLAHNLTLIIRELKANKATVNVSWLPQYHDMGLIGSYLGVLYCGGVGYYLSPISFLKDPVVWIRAMSRFQGTHTQAPNFAYALASRKFKEALASEPGFASKVAANLNLSSLQHMINAAEPVDVAAIREFYAIFSTYGLPARVVVPTYGLAEHTVFVCSGGRQVVTVDKASLEAGAIEIVGDVSELHGSSSGRGGSGNPSSSALVAVDVEESLLTKEHATVPTTTAAPPTGSVTSKDVQQIVGCGFPTNGESVDVVIVNSNANSGATGAAGDSAEEVAAVSEYKALPEGMVGEIWVNSPSKAQGYWGQESLSEEEFHATLTSSSSSNEAEKNEYLRTGDLGFLYQNELFICGRMKDLIIVRGSNHYPQDIERTAEQHQSPFLRAGCSAAFSLKGADGRSTEDVVYIAELKEKVPASAYEGIAQAIKDIISTNHGLALYSVCLLMTRSVPKTTSGKIARAWCRRGYLEGSLKIVHQVKGGNSSSISSSNSNATKSAAMSIGNGGAATSSTSSSGQNYARVFAEENVNEGAAAVSTNSITVAPAGGGGSSGSSSGGGGMKSAEEVRAMSIGDIIKQLEKLLFAVASQGPSPLTGPTIDAHLPVTAMGLDSMTIVQFKGVLEKRFYADIPDDFLFTSIATLEQLAHAVKLGTLTESQRSQYESALADHKINQNASNGDTKGNPQDPNAPSTVMVQQNEPCCPWFTFCM